MGSEEDSKKFFDKKNYNTIIVGNEGGDSKKNKKASIVDLLAQDNKDIREDALKLLKQANSADIIVEAIKASGNHPKKHLLVAACWEANIDCKNHLEFFTELALNDTYEVCLEALTVIEEMQGPFDGTTVKNSLKKVEDWLKKNPKSEKLVLIENLKSFLQNYI